MDTNFFLTYVTNQAYLTDSEIATLVQKKLNRHVPRRTVNGIVRKNGLRTKKATAKVGYEQKVDQADDEPKNLYSTKQVLEIANQNPNLSDVAITNLLRKSFGIAVSRKTVSRILRRNGIQSCRIRAAAEVNNAVVKIANENAHFKDSEIAILVRKTLNRDISRERVGEIIRKNGLRTKMASAEVATEQKVDQADDESKNLHCALQTALRNTLSLPTNNNYK